VRSGALVPPLALTLATVHCGAARTSFSAPSQAAVVDLGALSMPAIVVGRDGGAGIMVGGRMLWLFGDTLMTREGADGFNYRTSTAAWSRGGTLAVEEPLDAAGAPFELVPYTPEELAYNRAGGPSERYALWPGSAVAEPDGSVLFVYSKLKVHPGDMNYEGIGVGLAHLAPGSTIATRDAGLLFAGSDPAFADGGVLDGGYYYLYAIDTVPHELDSIVGVARAPLARVADRGAWTAWDGADWNADLARAVPVMHGPAGFMSVSRNAYVGGLLAVYGGIFSDDVWYRTALRPQGPWSDARLLFVTPVQGSEKTYCAYEHPELATDGGRTLVVSYSHPMGGFRGEVRLARVRLP
jgi:hypothetical protein